MKWRIGVVLVSVFGFFGVAVLSGCSGGGACVGTGGIVDECKEDWTQGECEDWDAQGVNGANWTYHPAQLCSDLGYTVQCADGSWVTRAGDC